MSLRKNESAFSTVEIILVVLVFVLLCAAGWLVYDRQNKHDARLSTDLQQVTTFEQCAKLHPVTASYPAQCTDNGKTFTQQVTTQTDSQQYLVIKEWGVKLPLTSDIKDMYYEYQGGALDGNGVYLALGKYKNTPCNTATGSFGFVTRDTVSAMTHEAGEAYRTETKVGQYYYDLYQSPCITDENYKEKSEDQINRLGTDSPTYQSVRQAFKKLVAN